jgi:hypothetical protein
LSDTYAAHISSDIHHIEDVLRHEMSACVHYSKINALFQFLKSILSILSSQAPPGFPSTPKFRDAATALIGSVDRLLQLSTQCTREVCSNSFIEIRQQTTADLTTLGYPSAAESFSLGSNELLSQDQVDLKHIGIFLQTLCAQYDLARPPDVRESVAERLKSLQRNGIPVEVNEADPIEILSLPMLPGSLTIVFAHEQLSFQETIGNGRSGRVFREKW